MSESFVCLQPSFLTLALRTNTKNKVNSKVNLSLEN